MTINLVLKAQIVEHDPEGAHALFRCLATFQTILFFSQLNVKNSVILQILNTSLAQSHKIY
jgi:hypothetical protein